MPCISEKPGAYSEIPRTLFSLERNHWSMDNAAVARAYFGALAEAAQGPLSGKLRTTLKAVGF